MRLLIIVTMLFILFLPAPTLTQAQNNCVRQNIITDLTIGLGDWTVEQGIYQPGLGVQQILESNYLFEVYAIRLSSFKKGRIQAISFETTPQYIQPATQAFYPGYVRVDTVLFPSQNGVTNFTPVVPVNNNLIVGVRHRDTTKTVYLTKIILTVCVNDVSVLFPTPPASYDEYLTTQATEIIAQSPGFSSTFSLPYSFTPIDFSGANAPQLNVTLVDTEFINKSVSIALTLYKMVGDTHIFPIFMIITLGVSMMWWLWSFVTSTPRTISIGLDEPIDYATSVAKAKATAYGKIRIRKSESAARLKSNIKTRTSEGFNRIGNKFFRR